MLEFHKKHTFLQLCLTVQCMGKDMCLHLFGGASPEHSSATFPCDAQMLANDNLPTQGAHVGAVALALPRPSNSGSGAGSASVSLLTVPGHQEDMLARHLALLVARQLGITVVLVCGIHVDKATADTIQSLETMAHSLVDDLLAHFNPALQKDSPCYK